MFPRCNIMNLGTIPANEYRFDFDYNDILSVLKLRCIFKKKLIKPKIQGFNIR
jgi:hypothetical protein